MATKTVLIDDIGSVDIHKRRGSKNIRLSLTHGGTVRVTIPFWTPFKVGEAFVRARKEWVIAQRPAQSQITNGYRIGKAHSLAFEPGSGSTVSTRMSGGQARVLLPTGMRYDDLEAQRAAQAVGVRVLKKEAKQLLPQRLRTLANEHGYDYRSVAIKQLTGRWGSCSQEKDIVLNCFLMQLPWPLIDYVLLHELAHTKIMAHGTVFWDEMRRTLPNVDALRKEIKARPPIL